MNTYTVEHTRSGHILLVQWPQEGSSIAMAYSSEQIGRAIIGLEGKGYEAKGRNAIQESRKANLGTFFEDSHA